MNIFLMNFEENYDEIYPKNNISHNILKFNGNRLKDKWGTIELKLKKIENTMV